MSFLHLVRHGQTQGFPRGAYVDLTSQGVAQAQALGRWWAEHGPSLDAVFVGPRERHVQTHQHALEALVARGGAWPAYVPLESLDEHEGQKVFAAWLAQPEQAQIRQREWRSEDRALALRTFREVLSIWAAGGGPDSDAEPFEVFQQRTGAALQRMTRGGGRGHHVAAFTSAGVIGSLVARVMGCETSKLPVSLSFQVYNASVTTFRFSGDRVTLHRFNTTPHLYDSSSITAI